MTHFIDILRERHVARAAALVPFGVTTRQAEFLATVMVHAGVCLRRQYCQFAGISHGQAVHDFFNRLIQHKWATRYPTRRGAYILHIHSKTLYRAIGQTNSRLRRPPTAPRAIERLMKLDLVLDMPDRLWCATERDKVDYCVDGRAIDKTVLPSAEFISAGGRTLRYFADKMPIGLTKTGDVTFLYLVTDPAVQPFREFVERHRALLERLIPWRLIVAIPRGLEATEVAHRAVLSDLLASPLRLAVVDEFRWYCQTRQLAERAPATLARIDAARYQRARRVFGAPRFFAAYQRWKQHGDATLHQLPSPVLHDAALRGHATFETRVLPHAYAHLSAIAQTA